MQPALSRSLVRSRFVKRAAVSDRAGTAALALVLALGVFGVSGLSLGLGDAPLFLLVLPLALGSIAYGLRGGVGFGVLCSGLATAWWLEHGELGGAAWLTSRSVACVLVGVLVGWFVDSRQRLLREIEHHAELSLDLIATASFDGYFTRVNPAFTRIFGYQPEELVAKPFLDFVHPDDREATMAAASEQTEAGHEVMNFQNRYRAKDGSYRWLEWTSRPDPEAKTLIAIARDITDRKDLEEREHRYQERLEQAVQERTRKLRQQSIELEEARRETLRRLALAAEFRDDETLKHTERVGTTAALIAAELGLDDHTVAVIREAALLHDVGKIGVSDAILLKPGRLTQSEDAEMKTHSQTGASILAGSSSDVLQVAEEIALSHHEWWDGSGYPNGLRGDEIPLEARIVALADVFDALTHTRPYKEAWPIDQAVDEIQKLRGRQFDPQVVDAFDQLDPRQLAGTISLAQKADQTGHSRTRAVA